LLFTVFIVYSMKVIIIFVTFILTVDSICQMLPTEDVVKLLSLLDNPTNETEQIQQLLSRCNINLKGVTNLPELKQNLYHTLSNKISWNSIFLNFIWFCFFVVDFVILFMMVLISNFITNISYNLGWFLHHIFRYRFCCALVICDTKIHLLLFIMLFWLEFYFTI